MELREIEIFLALAEELHFGRTAERLHVTPARVSQAIKKQERAIGAELFRRTSRSVQLTPIGAELRDGLAAGLRQIQDALAAAAEAGKALTGELRIGYSSAWCGSLVLAAADTFRSRHPQCLIELVDLQLADPVKRLRQGLLDLTLLEMPIDEPDLVSGPVVFVEPRALVVPVAHPLARRESVSLEDLADAPMIAVTDQPSYFIDLHYPRRTPRGRLIPRGPSAIAWQEVLALVAAGKGVSPTCLRAANYYSRPDIAFVPFSDAPPVEYGFLRSATGNTAKVRAFVETVLETARTGEASEAAPPGTSA
ncbi:LysR family transcriptional regulator [Streptomyces sp. NPDC059166]|uniref:LysR family transcriptional regulator n=1 Tax=Streptomyces sp. NPDC059166 TaxID=3346752 RepID=UPI0036C0C85F